MTGGTFGSTDKNGIRVLGDTLSAPMLNLLKPKSDFDYLQPLNILSENITTKEWQILLDTLKTIDFSAYRGIIVTHGTDTLSFSAAFVSHITKGLNLPIVFVASSDPLSHPNSNGVKNFLDAKRFIDLAKFAGTFVCYNQRVYLGKTIEAWRAFTNTYVSFPRQSKNDDFGAFMDNKFFEINAAACREHLICNVKESVPLFKSLTKLTSNILIVRPYPDIDYNQYDLCKANAVIHTMYHSFTYSNSIKVLQERCKNLNIPLILAPTSTDYPIYASKLDELVEMPNLSLETVYAHAVCNSLH